MDFPDGPTWNAQMATNNLSILLAKSVPLGVGARSGSLKKSRVVGEQEGGMICGFNVALVRQESQRRLAAQGLAGGVGTSWQRVR